MTIAMLRAAMKGLKGTDTILIKHRAIIVYDAHGKMKTMITEDQTS